jgi:ribosomal protein L37AE/L43A
VIASGAPHRVRRVWKFKSRLINRVMIRLCPYCGHELVKPINNGITSCGNCSRIFDSSPYHRLLSAGWLVRKWHLCCPEQLLKHGYTQQEAEVAVGLVFDQQYNPQEYVKIVDELGVSRLAG